LRTFQEASSSGLPVNSFLLQRRRIGKPDLIVRSISFYPPEF
jgi:hypothetical protein